MDFHTSESFENVYIANFFQCHAFFQGHGKDTVNYGVLHVEGTKGSQDFCITYTLKWSDESLPVQLDLTVNFKNAFSLKLPRTGRCKCFKYLLVNECNNNIELL